MQPVNFPGQVMSLCYLPVQHEAQWVSPPAWKPYTGDATAESISNGAPAFPFSDATASSQLSAFPGDRRWQWVSVVQHCPCY